MNKIYSLLVLCLGPLCMSLNSCPTCVGKAHEKNAPFFTDECYKEVAIEPADFKQTDTLSLGQTDKGNS